MVPFKTAIFSAIVAVASLPAFAVTINTDTVLPSFTGMLQAPTSSSANFRLNYVGSDLTAPAPNSRTPWEGTAVENTAYYNSIERGGFAEYVFANARTAFSLMWGSPDSYNTLRFLDAGDNEVYSIAGNNSAITSTAGYVGGRGFVNVVLSNIDAFTKVRFESGSDAFEFSNVAPVPLPAGILTLGAALGGLTIAARKRRASRA